VLEHLRVGAELEEKVRLRVASELRVGDVIAPGAEPRWAWIALGSRDSGDLGVLDVRGVALGEV
jgi:hypothetical protein